MRALSWCRGNGVEVLLKQEAEHEEKLCSAAECTAKLGLVIGPRQDWRRSQERQHC